MPIKIQPSMQQRHPGGGDAPSRLGTLVSFDTALSVHAVNHGDPDGPTYVPVTSTQGLIFATIVS